MKNKNIFISLLIIILVLVIGMIIVNKKPQDVQTGSLSAVPCNTSVPTVSVSPVANGATQNQWTLYQLYVKNNDSGGCTPAFFNMGIVSGNINWHVPNYLKSAYIGPGKFTYQPFYLIAPSGTPAGNNSFTISDVNANSTFSANASFTFAIQALTDTAPPSAPTALTVMGTAGALLNAQTGSSEYRVALKWNTSTDDFGVSGYNVYKGNTLVASVKSEEAQDLFGGTSSNIPNGTYAKVVGGLAANTTYSFSVKAVDKNGNLSASSNSVSTTTSGSLDSTLPSVPNGLTITQPTATTAVLAWNASTDNTWVNSYAVGTDDGELWHCMKLTATSCKVTGLTSNTKFKFRILAFDLAGNL